MQPQVWYVYVLCNSEGINLRIVNTPQKKDTKFLPLT